MDKSLAEAAQEHLNYNKQLKKRLW